MARIDFWRGNFKEYTAKPKSNNVLYFVSGITMGSIGVDNSGNPIPYSAIFLGNSMLASSQKMDVDLDSISSIIGDLVDLDPEINDKSVVESINYILNKVNINTEKINFNTENIKDLSEIVGDGVFTHDSLVGMNITGAINSLSKIIGNTVEGSIGDLDSVNDDIKGDDIISIINKLDNKHKISYTNTQDDYKIASYFNRITYNDIKNKTAEQALEMIFFSDMKPKILEKESVEFAMSNITEFKEIGEVLSSEVIIKYNQGIIGVNDYIDTIKSFKGLPNSYSILINNNLSYITDTQDKICIISVNDYIVKEGVNSWSVGVNYGDGDIPISSKNNECLELQGLQGEIISNSINFYGVYPILSNSNDIYIMDHKTLVSEDSQTVDIQYNTKNNNICKYKLAIPKNPNRAFLAKIEMFNNLSNKYEEQDISFFTKMDDIIIDINGHDVIYDIYECTESTIGFASFRFTFTN